MFGVAVAPAVPQPPLTVTEQVRRVALDRRRAGVAQERAIGVGVNHCGQRRVSPVEVSGDSS